MLKRLSLKGFILSDYLHKVPEIMGIFLAALEQGALRIDAGNETILDATFEQVPAVWMKLFEGINTGKLVTRLVHD